MGPGTAPVGPLVACQRAARPGTAGPQGKAVLWAPGDWHGWGWSPRRGRGLTSSTSACNTSRLPAWAAAQARLGATASRTASASWVETMAPWSLQHVGPQGPEATVRLRHSLQRAPGQATHPLRSNSSAAATTENAQTHNEAHARGSMGRAAWGPHLERRALFPGQSSYRQPGPSSRDAVGHLGAPQDSRGPGMPVEASTGSPTRGPAHRQPGTPGVA